MLRRLLAVIRWIVLNSNQGASAEPLPDVLDLFDKNEVHEYNRRSATEGRNQRRLAVAYAKPKPPSSHEVLPPPKKSPLAPHSSSKGKSTTKVVENEARAPSNRGGKDNAGSRGGKSATKGNEVANLGSRSGSNNAGTRSGKGSSSSVKYANSYNEMKGQEISRLKEVGRNRNVMEEELQIMINENLSVEMVREDWMASFNQNKFELMEWEQDWRASGKEDFVNKYDRDAESIYDSLREVDPNEDKILNNIKNVDMQLEFLDQLSPLHDNYKDWISGFVQVRLDLYRDFTAMRSERMNSAYDHLSGEDPSRTMLFSDLQYERQDMILLREEVESLERHLAEIDEVILTNHEHIKLMSRMIRDSNIPTDVEWPIRLDTEVPNGFYADYLA